ncbi:restriction endonuclease [Corallococcus sicarius]|uniref:Type II restriction endonuclease n=1 Tax=Corallococcus sicarius TaxID=2316726 RepID=A0A3A8NQ37_9BACT|nr:restriction endonuclease [Corallococcus sicarius]RKH45609.1 type II restriction endonuclease [Corallococcus sicarius]
MKTTWMVRAGRGSENIEEFLRLGIVAMGDARLGKLSPSQTKADLLRLYAEKYPEESEGTRATWASQSARFVSEMKAGDGVITYDSERRLYFVGSLTSDYEWAPQLIESKPHMRRVTWAGRVSRDGLSAAARNSLGAIQSLFKLGPDVVTEMRELTVPLDAPIESAAPPPAPMSPPIEGKPRSDAELSAEMFDKAGAFVEDAISRLDWQQMQHLVAGILRSMGYRTQVSEEGPDRGVDIFASPDGLGLQEPRIFVEVKHRPGTPMGTKEIRSFLGGRKERDKCLYVSTGGFTKDAHYEAERSSVALTLIALPRLRELLLDRYEQLDSPTRALVPLQRFYWPSR